MELVDPGTIVEIPVVVQTPIGPVAEVRETTFGRLMLHAHFTVLEADSLFTFNEPGMTMMMIISAQKELENLT